jgi:hypothetical protein
LDALRALGLEVFYLPDLKDATLAEALSSTQADILVVRSTKVTDAILEAGQLSLVVRAGAGYDTIDVKGASRRGIYLQLPRQECRGGGGAHSADPVPDRHPRQRGRTERVNMLSKALLSRPHRHPRLGSIAGGNRRAQAFDALPSGARSRPDRPRRPAISRRWSGWAVGRPGRVDGDGTSRRKPRANCDILSVHSP